MTRSMLGTSIIILTLLIGWSIPVQAEFSFSSDLNVEELWEEWLDSDHYFTMLDPDGNPILQTARRIYVDDEYLTTDNRLYRVVKVDENKHEAYAEFVEELELDDTRLSLRDIRKELGISVAEAQEDEQGRIAVYHTHNAESYVPTDGTDSIDGEGGIHAVGQSFAGTLSNLGINVDYSENLHLPHDRGAYRRSRGTVLNLLSREPDAIFDVHRDAAPRNEYAAQVENEWVTQVQFVVGRQNQNLGINRQFATSMKAIADQVYPGLVKGIYFGRGNYNQDLTPLSLLLEVGAHTNSREAAERGISLFAEVVDFYFYGPREGRQAADEGAPSGAIGAASRTALWLIAFVLAGGAIFYVVNAGGWKEALERIKGLFRLK